MSLNTSSLLDLKAELLKKSEEIKKDKLQRTSKLRENSAIPKKTSVFSRKNAGVLERAQRDLEAKQEEDDIISASRKKLEAKARVYEQMIGGGKVVTEHDGSKGFLVDFEQKSIRVISDKREQERIATEKKEEEEERKVLQEKLPEPEEPNEQWVDYVDSFGRSRRCLRKDLPELQKMDRKLQGTKQNEITTDMHPDENKRDLMSADMYRELVRQKWEEEETNNMTNPDGPTHYANVQYNEIRTHGVGYYQFDKDHGTREEQLNALKLLREETKELRDKKQQVKRKRKAMLKARLAKVKQRKMVREGKDPEAQPEAESCSESSDEEHMIGPRLDEMDSGQGRSTSPEPLTRDDSLRKDAPVREWDLGKNKTEFDEEKWLTGRRDERVDDFAPPSFYYNEQTKPKKVPENTPPHASMSVPKVNKLFRTNGDSGGSESKFSSVSRNVEPEVKDPMAMLDAGNENAECKDNAIASNLSYKAKDPMALLESETISSEPSNVTSVHTEQFNAEDMVARNLQQLLKQIDHEKIDDSVNTPINSSTHSASGQIADVCSNNWALYSTTLSYSEQNHNYPMGYPMGQNARYYAPTQYAHAAGVPPAPTEANSSVRPHDGVVPTSSTWNRESKYFVYTPVHSEIPAANTTSVSGVDNLNLQASETSKDTTDAIAKATQNLLKTGAQISSAPIRYNQFNRPLPQPKYERVNLHELPTELKAPPSASNIPIYPSQEEIYASKKEPTAKDWQNQFCANAAKKQGATHNDKPDFKPKNIPFVSPYVQRDAGQTDTSEDKILFDPAKPPPNLKNTSKP